MGNYSLDRRYSISMEIYSSQLITFQSKLPIIDKNVKLSIKHCHHSLNSTSDALSRIHQGKKYFDIVQQTCVLAGWRRLNILSMCDFPFSHSGTNGQAMANVALTMAASNSFKVLPRVAWFRTVLCLLRLCGLFGSRFFWLLFVFMVWVLVSEEQTYYYSI